MRLLDLIFEDEDKKVSDEEVATLRDKALATITKKMEKEKDPDKKKKLREQYIKLKTMSTENLKKLKIFDFTNKKKEENPDDIQAKAQKEVEKHWSAQSEITQSEAIRDLKKNIAKDGTTYRGNVLLADKQFPGKSIQDFANEHKKEPFTQNEVQSLIGSSDKAFIDAVSILSQLKVLQGSSASSFTPDNVNYLLSMLSNGTSIENAINNLKTWYVSDTSFYKLKKQANELGKEIGETYAALNNIEENRKKDIENAKAKEIERAKNQEYDKEKGNADLQGEIFHINNSYDDRKKNLEREIIRLKKEAKKIEEKLTEKRKGVENTIYSPGKKFQEMDVLFAKAQVETDPKKKKEYFTQAEKMRQDWNARIDTLIDERRGTENEIANLKSQISTLDTQIEKAKKDGDIKVVKDLINNKELKTQKLNELSGKLNDNVFAETKKGPQKVFRTKKELSFSKPSEFVNELRNSIFTMGKNILPTLTRAINLLYYGSDRADTQGNFGRLPTKEERNILKIKNDIKKKADFVEVEDRVDADIQKWSKNNEEKLKVYNNNLEEIIQKIKNTENKKFPQHIKELSEFFVDFLPAAPSIDFVKPEAINRLTKKFVNNGDEIYDNILYYIETRDEMKKFRDISEEEVKTAKELRSTWNDFVADAELHPERVKNTLNKFIECAFKAQDALKKDVMSLISYFGDKETLKREKTKNTLDNAINRTKKEISAAKTYKNPSWADIQKRVQKRMEEE